MAEYANQTEMERRNALRLSNEESNRLTRECIEAALVLLMKDHDFQSISITDIIRKAGVSRSAYYRNYSSKEDVLRNVFNRVEDAIMDKIRVFLNDDSFSAYQELFQAFAQKANVFQIIIKAGMTADYIKEMNRRFTSDLPEGNFSERYRKYFWIGALANVVFTWIEDGMKQTSEEMAAFFESYPIHPQR